MYSTVGWHTTQTATGFTWTIEAIGYQVPSVIIKTGHCATRAQATGKAKTWVLYYRRIGAAAAIASIAA